MKTKDFLFPIKGELLSIEKVPDPIFNERVMGDGFAIDILGDNVIAPISGIVTSVFPGGHAVCIEGDEGINVLIHIGLETYNIKRLNDIRVTKGQYVEKGELLVKTNHKKIRKKALSSITPIVFLNKEKIRLLKENQILEAGTNEVVEISLGDEHVEKI